MTRDRNGAWWGTYEIPVGTAGRWRIGPFELWAERTPGEWRLSHSVGDDAIDSTLEVEVPSAAPTNTNLTVRRVAVAGSDGTLNLTPRLADRSIISRPKEPFDLPSGQETVVYVSTPLWLALHAADGSLLAELPFFRPSDTWFGATPLSGELAYATRAAFRLRAEEIPRRPHRAATAVTLRNDREDTLALERLSVPVRHLALYASDTGALCTEDVRFERTDAADSVQLRMSGAGWKQPPPGTTLVSEARLPPEDNLALRVFGSLFS